VIENIARHLEMGKPRMQAALDGAQEIGFTVLSMTISLAAVFLPILFMGGMSAGCSRNSRSASASPCCFPAWSH